METLVVHAFGCGDDRAAIGLAEGMAKMRAECVGEAFGNAAVKCIPHLPGQGKIALSRGPLAAEQVAPFDAERREFAATPEEFLVGRRDEVAVDGAVDTVERH